MVTLSIASPGGTTLNGTDSVAASGGVATFTDVLSNAAGVFSLTASDGTLTTATSADFTVSPAAAAKVVFTQEPTNAGVGSGDQPGDYGGGGRSIRECHFQR